MYIRTFDGWGGGLGQPKAPPKSPPPALQKSFTSSVVVYKDSAGTCQSTNCAVSVPSSLRDLPKIDLLVFFHGLDTCDPHYASDPQRVVNNFRLADQVDKAARKAALVVPLVSFVTADRQSGVIRAAWSAAYLNAFVEEALNEIGKSSRVRPDLDHLIIGGHSAGYEILVPLAEQFDCGTAETKKGALAKLSKVLAMDIPHGERHAKALVDWASSRSSVQFFLVFAQSGIPPSVWDQWRTKTAKVPLPKNITVLNMKNEHCELPGKYVQLLL